MVRDDGFSALIWNRLAQMLNSIHIEWPSTVQSTILGHPIWASLCTRRCGWSGIPTSNGNGILHTQRQKARRRRSWLKNPKLLPNGRCQRTMYRTRQFRPKRIRIHRSKRQKVGISAPNRQPCPPASIRQRTRQHITRSRKRRRAGRPRCISSRSRPLKKSLRSNDCRGPHKPWTYPFTHRYQSRPPRTHSLPRRYRRGHIPRFQSLE